MARQKEITYTGGNRKSAWESTKDFFGKIVREIKWFIYGIFQKIHSLFTKVVPQRKERSVKSKKLGAAIFAHVIIAYPLLQFLVFWVFVNINSILLSFQEYDLATSTFHYTDDLFINFRNFINDIKADETMFYCIKNSLLSYVIIVIISYPVRLTFSYIIYKKVPCGAFFQVILFLPSILSSVVISMMFEMFVKEAVPYVAANWFNVKKDVFLLGNPDYVFGTMLFYAIWLGFGSSMILYYGAMSRIPDSIIEFGELEGITMYREFMSVVLPMIYSTVTIFLVTGIAGIFTIQLDLYNFFGASAPIQARTLGYHFFIMVLGENSAQKDYPYASASGLMFTFVAAPLTLLARYLFEKFGPTVEF